MFRKFLREFFTPTRLTTARISNASRHHSIGPRVVVWRTRTASEIRLVAGPWTRGKQSVQIVRSVLCARVFSRYRLCTRRDRHASLCYRIATGRLLVGPRTANSARPRVSGPHYLYGTRRKSGEKKKYKQTPCLRFRRRAVYSH